MIDMKRRRQDLHPTSLNGAEIIMHLLAQIVEILREISEKQRIYIQQHQQLQKELQKKEDERQRRLQNLLVSAQMQCNNNPKPTI